MASTNNIDNIPQSNINNPASSSQSQSETNNTNNTKNVESTNLQQQSVQTQSQQIQSPLLTLGNPISSTPSLTVTPASPNTSPTTTQEEIIPKPINPPSTEVVNTNTTKEIDLNSQSHPSTSDQTQAKPTMSTSKNEVVGETSKSNNDIISNSTPSSKALVESSKEKSTSTPTTTTTSTTKSSPTNSQPLQESSTSSTTKPINNTSSTSKSQQKKKKKRKGLAGFLLTLGCLNADEFEEDPKKVKSQQQQVTQKPNTSVTTSPTITSPQTTTATTQVKDKKVDETQANKGSLGHQVEPTATTGSTLVETHTDADKAVKPNEELVVAPTEPHILPDEETAGVTSSAVQPPGGGSSLHGTPTRSHPQRRDSDLAAPSTSADQDRTETSGGYTDISNSEIQDEGSSAAAEEGVDEYGLEEEYEDEEDRLIEQGGMGIPIDENGQPAPLLPPILKEHHGRKCLVLDLDETLLHSSFKSLPSADYIVPVEIESQIHNVYVIKRPGVDHFLKEMGKIYEVVIFTASLSKYADPVLDMLDIHRVVTHRLFRESCYNHKGNYVKDLSQLGRSIETSIIIDNSPASYIFHPNNAVPVSTWFNDPHDTELTDLCPFLADLATVDDVRGVLDGRMN